MPDALSRVSHIIGSHFIKKISIAPPHLQDILQNRLLTKFPTLVCLFFWVMAFACLCTPRTGFRVLLQRCHHRCGRWQDFLFVRSTTTTRRIRIKSLPFWQNKNRLEQERGKPITTSASNQIKSNSFQVGKQQCSNPGIYSCPSWVVSL
jgi:hypothetical protein